MTAIRAQKITLGHVYSAEIPERSVKQKEEWRKRCILGKKPTKVPFGK